MGQRNCVGKIIFRNRLLCLIFLHRFYIPMGKTLQRAAIMKTVEMRKKEIKHIKKRKRRRVLWTFSAYWHCSAALPFSFME